MTEPAQVLSFWFGHRANGSLDTDTERPFWFKKSDETDAHIAREFKSLLDAMPDGLAEDWASKGPRDRLAAILVTDQFSRNIYRDTPDAFAFDALARKLVRDGQELGDDRALSIIERWFFFMPLQHSEARADHELSLELYAGLRDEATGDLHEVMENTYDFARRHAEIVFRFGRFPHRNEILGRVSSDDEIVFLQEPGSRF